MQLMTSDQP